MSLSSSDRLTPKTYPQNQTANHTAEVISIQSSLASPHTPRGQPISEMTWWDPLCVWYGRPHLSKN